ncbi:hypothetical protein [Trichloromonas sp.]|uniref:hypothetical protein n=1 Tax=Trichloromonas sp. TaxID=3069249 RepID=UPI002A44F8F5|nr:hypothetical protein [Trichloromonas sp.]
MKNENEIIRLQDLDIEIADVRAWLAHEFCCDVAATVQSHGRLGWSCEIRGEKIYGENIGDFECKIHAAYGSGRFAHYIAYRDAQKKCDREIGYLIECAARSDKKITRELAEKIVDACFEAMSVHPDFQNFYIPGCLIDFFCRAASARERRIHVRNVVSHGMDTPAIRQRFRDCLAVADTRAQLAGLTGESSITEIYFGSEK